MIKYLKFVLNCIFKNNFFFFKGKTNLKKGLPIHISCQAFNKHYKIKSYVQNYKEKIFDTSSLERSNLSLKVVTFFFYSDIFLRLEIFNCLFIGLLFEGVSW